MILPKTFVNPPAFRFLHNTYIDGVSSLGYCTFNTKDKKYIMSFNDIYYDYSEPNITQDHIGWSYIVNHMIEYEREIYKSQIIKELGITFRYIK